MREHLLRFGTEQHGGNTFASMARHEDDVAVVLFGLFDDGLSGRETLRHQGKCL